MAATKESLIIVLDVGESMGRARDPGGSSNLDQAIRAVQLLLQQKMLHKKRDEVGLVLYGTADTKNALDDSGAPGYKNIRLERPIVTPDLDFVRAIRGISSGHATGDLISALVVGMQHLYERTRTKKVARRVFLLTDGESRIHGQEDLGKLRDRLKETQTVLNIIGIDFDDEDEDEHATTPAAGRRHSAAHSEQKAANQRLLRQLCEDVDGMVLPCARAIEMLGAMRARSVGQTTSFRGPLEIGPDCRIQLFGYKRVKVENFPRLSKLSTVSQQSDNPRTMKVESQRTYKIVDEPDADFDDSQKRKAFRYGDELIPFAAEDVDNAKVQASKGIQLLAFCPASQIPRYHYISDVDVFVHAPGSDGDARALTALAHALQELDHVMIVRMVKRDKSAPVIGVMWPVIKSEAVTLMYCNLPFCQDIRQFKFNPLDLKPNLVPTKEQHDAADALVASLDLCAATFDADGDPVEAVRPRHTFHPCIQRFYENARERALNPSSALLPLDPVLAESLRPPAAMLQRNEAVINRFTELFPLVQATGPEVKAKRRYWKEAMDAGAKLVGEDDGPSAKRSRPEPTNGVREVGTQHPVEDFREMCERRDIDLVTTAMHQMCEVIVKLVDTSVRENFYPKALSCLAALREIAVKEEDGDIYNKFLVRLRTLYKGTGGHGKFWDRVASHPNNALTLISEDEGNDGVSAEDAANFFGQTLVPSVSQPVPMEVDETDDLLAMAD